jgi:CheY-specific phosphatase CheX
MNFPIDCYRSGMIQITESVFETMLGITVTGLEVSAEALEVPLTAAVYYAGAWRGALLIECSERHACMWSGCLMDIASPSPSDARDGLGEVANMLAGNLKPLLPPGVGISIPSVVEGSDYSLRICGGNLTEHIEFKDAIGRFRVKLVKVQTEVTPGHDVVPERIGPPSQPLFRG